MNEKNELKTNNMKKILLPIIGVVCLLLLVVGTSFAFFVYNGQGTTDNTVTAGTITFSYSDATVAGNGIKLENQMPISDADGKALSGDNNVFNFSVTANTTAASINYEIVADKQGSSTLLGDKVKIYLTDVTGVETPIITTIINEKVTKYSELLDTEIKDKTGKTIHKGVITKGQTSYKKDFRLRMWVSVDTDMSDPLNHNKSFSIKVNVYANVGVKEETTKLLKDAVIKSLGTTGTTYKAEDGSTYIRGESNVVNNYVWYSGMMWRVYRINPDGSVKVIMDDNASALPFHNENGSNVYETSHMKTWLNTYFWERLNTSKTTVLKQNNEFCVDSTDSSASVRETCTSTGTLPNQKIGLLTLDEYNIVKNGSDSNYLNNGLYHWTMTPYVSDASIEWFVDSFGSADAYNAVSDGYGSRAVVLFANAITIASGNGSQGDPYKITGDAAKATNGTKLNTRYSGELITYDNKLFRIMEVSNGLTKVVYDGTPIITPTGAFGSNNLDWQVMKTRLESSGISKSKLAIDQTWQRGDMVLGNNVLTTSLANGNAVTSTFGLARIGEMWASLNNTKTTNYAKYTNQSYWTMTPHTSDANGEWMVDSYGGDARDYDVGRGYGGRAVFFFANAITIAAGSGTPEAPYTLN